MSVANTAINNIPPTLRLASLLAPRFAPYSNNILDASHTFALKLSTVSSVQYSGEISVTAAASGSRSAVQEILAFMSNVDAGVGVSRSALNADGGYTWSITFAESMGNVPQLEVLTSDVPISIATHKEGNVLGGTFRVVFDGQQVSLGGRPGPPRAVVSNASPLSRIPSPARRMQTAEIPFDASTSEMQTKLQDLSNVGLVQVTRTFSSSQYQNGSQSEIQTVTTAASGGTDEIQWVVLKSSTANTVPEVQLVKCDATGGSFDLVFNGETAAQVAIAKRVYGGRGSTTSSQIHCTDTDSTCSTARERTSGSMQSKLQAVTNVVTNGVVVDRDGPDTNGGFTWRITFLDDAPDGSSDFVVTVASETISSSGSTEAKSNNAATTTGLVSAGSSPLVDGVTYTSCTGTLKTPTSGGLTKGTAYYARVMAFSATGYSVPQSVQGTAVAPTVVPGAPTGVTLEVTSSTELKVLFSPPSDNGGAAIEKYLIEYDTSSAFSSPTTAELTYLGGGSPFFKTLSGLTAGTFYFVRVSAYNQNGYGGTQVTTPASLNPHEVPSAPTNVALSVTSDSMLTVSWAAPTSNGGDAISGYTCEWDTALGFNSGSLSPHKGTVTVAATYTSTTVELLSGSTTYYFRCAALNSAGSGAYQTSSPVSAMPGLQVPGSPHSIVLAAGSTSGSISISWQRPKIPHHGIPCSGSAASPLDCPTPFGSTVPESAGGSSITSYEIEYSERRSFDGQDQAVSSVTGTSATLTGLTPGRIYFVRIFAKNQNGISSACSTDSTDTQVSVAATI